MKSDKRILIAFLLNLVFSVIEFFGGFLTKSVAVISDSIHDLGDAISIGISYILEKISKKKPDNKYTYGYLRYSILGAMITNTILIVGSLFVIINAINRIINPIVINYNGMIILAIIGFIINLFASIVTKEGESLNQKAVNLHMLEDVLGWLIVLIGAFVIKVTKFYIIDSILSILVGLFILYNALKSYKEVLDLFLEKIPNNIDIDEIKSHILKIHDVINIHHVHIWSIDGFNNYATMHIITDSKNINKLKNDIKEELKEHGISHTTIEIEDPNYECEEIDCKIKTKKIHNHHHHH